MKNFVNVVKPNIGFFAGSGKYANVTSTTEFDDWTKGTIIIHYEDLFSSPDTNYGKSLYFGAVWLETSGPTNRRGFYILRFNGLILAQLGADAAGEDTTIGSGQTYSHQTSSLYANKCSIKNAIGIRFDFTAGTPYAQSFICNPISSSVNNSPISGFHISPVNSVDDDDWGAMGTSGSIDLGSAAAGTGWTGGSYTKWVRMRMWKDEALSDAQIKEAIGGEFVCVPKDWVSEAVSGYPQPRHDWNCREMEKTGAITTLTNVGAAGTPNLTVNGSPHFGRFTNFDLAG